MPRINTLLASVSLLVAVGAGATAEAAVVRVEAANFIAGAGLITFSEFGNGTINPVYTPEVYGGGANSPTVTFGGFFAGQSLSANAGVDCPGAAATGCVVGTPTGSLALDPASPGTSITGDGAAPNSPVLSGSPLFDGPIALLFSQDQFGVGFDAGFFDNIASTGITAFARDGSLLGTVSNIGLGIEFLGLVSANADIAGVFLDLVGTENAGFAIDIIRFGVRGQVIDPIDPMPPIPLPAGLPLLAGALGLLAFARRRRG